MGLLPAKEGRVRLGGDPLNAFSRPVIAQRLAYVPQSHPPPFPCLVRDVVLHRPPRPLRGARKGRSGPHRGGADLVRTRRTAGARATPPPSRPPHTHPQPPPTG